MSLIEPDPGTLHRIAAQISEQAEAFRSAASRIAAATAAVRWHSPAARLFQHKSHLASARLRRCADRADDAAYLVHCHAEAIATQLAAGKR